MANNKFNALSGYQIKWRLFIFSVSDGYADEWNKFTSKCKRNFVNINKKNKIFWSHIKDYDNFILEHMPHGVSAFIVEITDKQFGMGKVVYGKGK